MKNMIFAIAAIMLLFGCVTPEAPEVNETIENITSVTIPDQIEEEKIVETLAVASVNGVFEHTDYEFLDNTNPFSDGAGGDLGKTSTAYIKVNENDLSFLSDVCENEEQAFWFNLKTREEKGVVFEAVYSVDLEGECDVVKFLGKEYEIEIMDKPENSSEKIVKGGTIKLKEVGSESSITLRDSGSFNNDDRWPVVLGWKNGELMKIIIYMGGYFYDIEADKDAVPLFGAGNRVLARFTDMETTPTFELITTDMTKVKKN